MTTGARQSESLLKLAGLPLGATVTSLIGRRLPTKAEHLARIRRMKEREANELCNMEIIRNHGYRRKM